MYACRNAYYIAHTKNKASKQASNQAKKEEKEKEEEEEEEEEAFILEWTNNGLKNSFWSNL